jgi:hypothetical protein
MYMKLGIPSVWNKLPARSGHSFDSCLLSWPAKNRNSTTRPDAWGRGRATSGASAWPIFPSSLQSSRGPESVSEFEVVAELRRCWRGCAAAGALAPHNRVRVQGLVVGFVAGGLEEVRGGGGGPSASGGATSGARGASGPRSAMWRLPRGFTCPMSLVRVTRCNTPSFHCNQ